jgi:ArsR family transcriptional regulator
MKLSEILKALADENRIRIVNLLLKEAELCVCEIETILELSQTNASRHLAKLKSAGMVALRKENQWAYYRIAEKFVSGHGLLLDYLKNALQDDETCVSDLEKLKKYKELGFNCEKIKCEKADVLKKIGKS